MAIAKSGSSHGVDFEVELEGDGRLTPGRVATGRARLVFGRGMEIRGAYTSLVGTERCSVTTRSSDDDGGTETSWETWELPRVPVRLIGAEAIVAGTTREASFELPVPPSGPATLQDGPVRIAWEVELKVDVPGLDPRLTVPVVVHQPAELARSAAGPAGAAASVEAAADGLRAAIALEPAPLVLGAPFRGSVTFSGDKREKYQEIRAELRLDIRATVSNGDHEEKTLWHDRLAGASEVGGETQRFDFAGELPATMLPTLVAPHGRATGTFHLVLGRRLWRDRHLVRDVAICSIAEA